jgi:hypothetical protein
MKKFLIFSVSYDETNGGAIVLHKLCSILNDLGYESYLHPYYESFELNRNNCIKSFNKSLKSFLFPWRKKYKTNPAFNTPVLKKVTRPLSEEWVAIYPEIVFGNPLKAENVVRWFLHQPGFHSGNVFYGKNELYFKFNNAIDDFSFPGSVTSSQHLKVIHYPLEHYNSKSTRSERHGTAYSLRKTKNKPLQHDTENSILIDGKTHEEISRIFKSVKTFISYDPYTAYSIFAVLCGCDSVVIPDEGVDENEWYPDPSDRYGIAYGFARLEESRKTAHLVKDHVIAEEKRSVKNVQSCVDEIEAFFK